MSIRIHIEDAEFLANNGRHLGALTVLMIAIAASSKRKFPKGIKSITNPSDKMRDDEAFSRFLGGRIRTILFGQEEDANGQNSGILFPFRGKEYDLAYILYKFYRCELAHDGVLPGDVEFSPTEVVAPMGGTINWGDQGVSIATTGNNVMLDYRWIDLLITAVTHAHCNAKEFGIRHYKLIYLYGSTAQDDEAFLTDVAKKYETSLARMQVMRVAVQALSPDLIAGAGNQDIVTRFKKLVDSGLINGGMITGLSSISPLNNHVLCDRKGILEERGIEILRHVAAGYRLDEVG